MKLVKLIIVVILFCIHVFAFNAGAADTILKKGRLNDSNNTEKNNQCTIQLRPTTAYGECRLGLTDPPAISLTEEWVSCKRIELLTEDPITYCKKKAKSKKELYTCLSNKATFINNLLVKSVGDPMKFFDCSEPVKMVCISNCSCTEVGNKYKCILNPPPGKKAEAVSEDIVFTKDQLKKSIKSYHAWVTAWNAADFQMINDYVNRLYNEKISGKKADGLEKKPLKNTQPQTSNVQKRSSKETKPKSKDKATKTLTSINKKEGFHIELQAGNFTPDTHSVADAPSFDVVEKGLPKPNPGWKTFPKLADKFNGKVPYYNKQKNLVYFYDPSKRRWIMDSSMEEHFKSMLKNVSGQTN